MGNAFFCNRCDMEAFELSRACVDQILKDDDGNELSSEEQWMLRLRCLDEAHSKRHGLTYEGIGELISKLEQRLRLEKPIYCKNRDFIIECLRRNPNCMLNCEREIDAFIDCVDALRIRKIKERTREARRKK